MSNTKSNFYHAQTVVRKIPSHIIVLQVLLYITVGIFVIIGTTKDFLWLIPPLGTLFLCWYMMGEARVSYEYTLDGHDLRVVRISGMRSKTKTVQFLHVDLHNVIIMAEENKPILDDAEQQSANASPKRITYDVSAHNSAVGCYVMYAMGIESESGRHLKIYFSPDGEMRDMIRLLCPGKVHLS